MLPQTKIQPTGTNLQPVQNWCVELPSFFIKKARVDTPHSFLIFLSPFNVEDVNLLAQFKALMDALNCSLTDVIFVVYNENSDIQVNEFNQMLLKNVKTALSHRTDSFSIYAWSELANTDLSDLPNSLKDRLKSNDLYLNSDGDQRQRLEKVLALSSEKMLLVLGKPLWKKINPLSNLIKTFYDNHICVGKVTFSKSTFDLNQTDLKTTQNGESGPSLDHFLSLEPIALMSMLDQTLRASSVDPNEQENLLRILGEIGKACFDSISVHHARIGGLPDLKIITKTHSENILKESLPQVRIQPSNLSFSKNPVVLIQVCHGEINYVGLPFKAYLSALSEKFKRQKPTFLILPFGNHDLNLLWRPDANQRFRVMNPDDQNEIDQKSLKAAEQVKQTEEFWIKEHEKVLSEFGCKVISWFTAVRPKLNPYSEEVSKKLQEQSNFRKDLLENATKFVDEFVQKHPSSNLNRDFSIGMAINYLKEECAALLLLIREYKINFYFSPGPLNMAMKETTRAFFSEPPFQKLSLRDRTTTTTQTQPTRFQKQLCADKNAFFAPKHQINLCKKGFEHPINTLKMAYN